MMFLRFLPLVVSSMTFLCVHQASSCNENCADKPIFTPSRLVVKHGDPTSAKCLVCERDCDGTVFDLEKNVGKQTRKGTTLVWTVDRMTEWDTDTLCFYNTKNDGQCCTNLPVTVYQPPENVSISFVNQTECGLYTLQCTVQKVAPVENLVVTFYRGTTALGRRQSNGNPEKKPVSENFTLSFNTSKEDNGAQYWCEAQLDLGPEGPQLPPVVTSETLTNTVHCFEPTSTRLPPARLPTTATTRMPTTTTKTTNTTGSSNSLSVHRFILCVLLLLSALV